MKETVVVAIGGNSLIKDEAHKSVEDQYETVIVTCKHLADIVEAGSRLVIVHGNGPQVGFILRRSAVSHEAAGIHQVPLSSCVADTQGAIGFQLQIALENELHRRGMKDQSATIITRVIVDENDELFQNPSKPIGSFFTEEQMKELKAKNPTWHYMEDSGRGFRRVVPSPIPKEIVELNPIRDLVDKDYVVIACGGGGIPVIKTDDGYKAVDAVIDKDRASAMLAEKINAKQFIISTGVSHVFINFGKPNEKKLEKVTLAEIKQYASEGHFAPGSMLPKIEAAIDFIEAGGEEVIITAPEDLKDAIEHKTGTIITK
ncbi:MAG: carbamate kinase [Denitrovibrio sp.]|nr:MAG: carbamate kinase [Denitrovibrio sp.]